MNMHHKQGRALTLARFQVFKTQGVQMFLIGMAHPSKKDLIEDLTFLIREKFLQLIQSKAPQKSGKMAQDAPLETFSVQKAEECTHCLARHFFFSPSIMNDQEAYCREMYARWIEVYGMAIVRSSTTTQGISFLDRNYMSGNGDTTKGVIYLIPFLPLLRAGVELAWLPENRRGVQSLDVLLQPENISRLFSSAKAQPRLTYSSMRTAPVPHAAGTVVSAMGDTAEKILGIVSEYFLSLFPDPLLRQEIPLHIWFRHILAVLDRFSYIKIKYILGGTLPAFKILNESMCLDVFTKAELLFPNENLYRLWAIEIKFMIYNTPCCDSTGVKTPSFQDAVGGVRYPVQFNLLLPRPEFIKAGVVFVGTVFDFNSAHMSLEGQNFDVSPQETPVAVNLCREILFF